MGIDVSAGGFGSAIVATVYFDNGLVIPFRARYATEFHIGEYYSFVYALTGKTNNMYELVEIL